jgi:hypothetical protein
VKGLRVAGACTLEDANAYLEREYLTWWNQTLAVQPADPADAHRPLGKEHDLAAILSHVEQRQVTNDYIVRYDAKVYQIDRGDVRPGMRKAWVRVEDRLDGTIAVEFHGSYVRVRRCAPPLHDVVSPKAAEAKLPRRTSKPKSKSRWMENFSVRRGR